MNQPWVYTCSPSWHPLPPPSPTHPSGSSQCTGPEHPVSRIQPGLAIYFTYGNIHDSLLFSKIIPSSPSPTGSLRLLKERCSLVQGPFMLHETVSPLGHFPKSGPDCLGSNPTSDWLNYPGNKPVHLSPRFYFCIFSESRPQGYSLWNQFPFIRECTCSRKIDILGSIFKIQSLASFCASK